MSLHDGSRWTAAELRERAAATGLPPTMRFVYLALDSYANGAPECYASQRTLRRITGLALSTLNVALDDLEAGGWIERVRGGGAKGGGGTTTLYVIADPICESDNKGSPAAVVLREPDTNGVKDKDLPLADQLKEEPLNPNPCVREPEYSGSRTTTNAKSARQFAGPRPKEADLYPGGHASDQTQRREQRKQRGAKLNPEKPATGAVAPRVPRHADVSPAPRLTAAERNAQRAAEADEVIERAVAKRKGRR